MTAWRADGSELYYVGPEREFMAASVRTSPTLAIGEPRRLFNLPNAIPTAANFDGVGNVSPDGSAVVLAVPPRIPPLAQVEMRVVDRVGTVVATPGKAGTFFGRPMLSPDGTKVAAGISEPLDNVFELWVFDLEADTERTQFDDRNINSWIWSEDGSELIYVSMDFNSGEGGGIFRRAADGSGSPELLYRHFPGTGFNLIDWSADGRFVLFISGGVLYVLPLDRDREPVELIREEFTVVQALLSQDSRFIAFTSDETRPINAWLWSFDPDAIAVGPVAEKLQLTTDGSGGPLSWGAQRARGHVPQQRGDVLGRDIDFRWCPRRAAARAIPSSRGRGQREREPQRRALGLFRAGHRQALIGSRPAPRSTLSSSAGKPTRRCRRSALLVGSGPTANRCERGWLRR